LSEEILSAVSGANSSTAGQLPDINPLNTELNPICHLLALLGAQPLFHVSRIRVKLI
jgi:hypothetical protein